MFDLPIEGMSRSLLYALLILWAGLLMFGLALGKPNPENTRRLPLIARMGMSAILVLAALVWWRAGTAPTALSAFGRFVLLGMAFGFWGDLFMARVIPTPNRVIFGILAFGLGHVFYILGFVQAGRVLGLDSSQTRMLVVAGYLAAAVLLWLLLVRSATQPAVMNYGTLGYSLLLAGMAGLALALSVQDGRLWPLALGGLLFLLSDLILGNQIMRGTSWLLIDDVVWMTYTVGQMLIVYSSGTTLRLLSSG